MQVQAAGQEDPLPGCSRKPSEKILTGQNDTGDPLQVSASESSQRMEATVNYDSVHVSK